MTPKQRKILISALKENYGDIHPLRHDKRSLNGLLDKRYIEVNTRSTPGRLKLQYYSVTELGFCTITGLDHIDRNHFYANIRYFLKITSVRPLTEEELEHYSLIMSIIPEE